MRSMRWAGILPLMKIVIRADMPMGRNGISVRTFPLRSASSRIFPFPQYSVLMKRASAYFLANRSGPGRL